MTSRPQEELKGRSRFQCDQCDRNFLRSEHLKRHQRKHQDILPFHCSSCFKRFSRSDTLARHELIHTYQGEDPVTTSNRLTGTGPDGVRACAECAKARSRCSKTKPCSRCDARSLRCNYPSKKQHFDLASNEHSINGSIARQSPDYDSSMGDVPDIQGYGSSQAGRASVQGSQILQPLNNDQNLSLDQNGSSGLRSDGLISTLSSYQEANSAVFEQSVVNVPHPVLTNEQTFGQAFDNSINWLPGNFDLDIDYTSILGMGTNALGMASFDQYNNPASLSTIPSTFGEMEGVSPSMTNVSHDRLSDRDLARERSISGRNSSTNQFSPPQQLPSPDYLPPDSVKGGLYATSTDGARKPCTLRLKGSNITVHGAHTLSCSHHENTEPQFAGYEFPNLSHISIEGPPGELDELNFISEQTYNQILVAFFRFCLETDILSPNYKSRTFPSISNLNYFVHLYFEHVNPIIPIIHRPSTRMDSCWKLALATAALGCQYTETEEFSKCVTPLQEFLRRVLSQDYETSAFESIELSVAQTMSLNQIGMLYGGSPRLASLARTNHDRLVHIMNQNGFLIPPDDPVVSPRSGNDEIWQDLVKLETKRRVGYMIWLLDSMRYYQFGMKPTMLLAEALAPLPNDNVWASQNHFDWVTALENTEECPPLSAAVQRIYRDGIVQNEIGEFGRILILHGIYRETWEVANYFQRPLSLWQPSSGRIQIELQSELLARDQTSGTKVSSMEQRGVKAPRLPEIPAYSNWRNASCDAVDVLHWAANSIIALHTGIEHPTVLHLHFSRTILLVPYSAIRELAISLASVTYPRSVEHSPSKNNIYELEHEVLNWAQRDEHKARLAALHAACVFWHVRRYSMRAFYEPNAVVLATLTLWAYSSYTSLAPREPQDQWTRNASPSSVHSDLSEDDTEPNFIWLDRPSDDEMVQLFVRSGHPSRMRASISGVGNICSPKGPRRILREGRKILSRLVLVWGHAREYLQILESLEKVMLDRSRRSKQNGSTADHR